MSERDWSIIEVVRGVNCEGNREGGLRRKK